MILAAIAAVVLAAALLNRECKRIKREEDYLKAKALVEVATRRASYISNKTTNWSD